MDDTQREPHDGSPEDGPGRTFLSAPVAVHTARDYARDVLATGPPLDDEQLDDVCLIVSELVTNAVRHGTKPGDSLKVVVDADDERVRVEVHDHVWRWPRFRPESTEATGGRGLHIVDALAARWGVEGRPKGKAVWAEVKR
ncbi:ATP-binding protein [Streptomyces sp. NPDC059913]|uniref:ATP-binding protein n=1 Tax=unclassified Streptomyces TaxID=2593676 RepID=UPI00364A8091